MKAYIASIEIEMPILAENESCARKMAKKYFQDEIDSCRPTEIDFSIQLMKRIPDGSDPNSFCWSENDDEITVEEGIKLNNEI